MEGKEGGIQVLAGLAPSSQTVGSNIRVIHEQAKRSSQTTKVKELGKVEATLHVAPNGGVQESTNSSTPRAARENLLADLESP
jgi:hypothetical protein